MKASCIVSRPGFNFGIRQVGLGLGEFVSGPDRLHRDQEGSCRIRQPRTRCGVVVFF
jgi:hypothetical protein